jgi:hypothetical protein
VLTPPSAPLEQAGLAQHARSTQRNLQQRKR